MTTTTTTLTLDLQGLDCPLPVLKTKKFLATLAPNTIVEILTTDPASQDDLADFCKKTGHHLISCELQGDIIHTVIKHRLMQR